jgi:hypothetical protein
VPAGRPTALPGFALTVLPDTSRSVRIDAIARRNEKIGDELTRKTAERTAGERNSIMISSPNGAMKVAEIDHLTISAQARRQVTRALRCLQICNALFRRSTRHPRQTEQLARRVR